MPRRWIVAESSFHASHGRLIYLAELSGAAEGLVEKHHARVCLAAQPLEVRRDGVLVVVGQEADIVEGPGGDGLCDRAVAHCWSFRRRP